MFLKRNLFEQGGKAEFPSPATDTTTPLTYSDVDSSPSRHISPKVRLS